MDYFVVGILGLIVGSFNSLMVYRIPREIPLGLFSHTRSFCPNCKKQIPIFRNIPVLGFFLGKGKCSSCKKPISKVYPTVEILTALSFLVTYYVLLHSASRPVEELEFFLELGKNFIFNTTLIATIFIDLEFRIIPDRFSLGGWVMALLCSALWGVPPFLHSLAGGLMGFGIFFVMAWGYERLKKVEGLGFGDVKMMGWLGSWLGIFTVPFVILISSLTGLVAGLIAMRSSQDGLKTAIPFGPFLAIGAYVVWVLMNLGIWSFGV